MAEPVIAVHLQTRHRVDGISDAGIVSVKAAAMTLAIAVLWCDM
jgi:hypothetical protein